MFLLVYVHLRCRPGRAWAAIRQSEPAALAAGINTTFYKLWAWALASFITGVAGARARRAGDRYLYSIDFPIQNSIILLAVVLMGGVFNLWGAVIAALLMQLLPAFLQNLGLSYDWLTILFGVGVLQVLDHRAGGHRRSVPEGHEETGRADQEAGEPAPASSSGPRRQGARRHDRGQGPDRPVRRRHLARRHEPGLRAGHLRAHRAERSGQDHVLQRAVRIRPARVGHGHAPSATTC